MASLVGAVSGFDWDDGNRRHCERQGLSCVEIERVFERSVRVAPDLKHAGMEDRLIAIGETEEGRAVFVAFTIRVRRGTRLIRPISARYMHAKEVKAYEAQGSADEDR